MVGVVCAGKAEEAVAQQPFITVWAIEAVDLTLTIPTNGEGVSPYDFTIDWGDGTTERVTGEDPEPSHSYVAPGTYDVQIAGVFPRIHLGEDSKSAVKLLDIKQWGGYRVGKHGRGIRERGPSRANLLYRST
ncbi:MAG: hypothetical protein RhofKO_02470 [Rhodothermales bacterium]